MIVRFTQQELAAQKALEERYNALMMAMEDKITALEPKPMPDTESFFAGLDPEKDVEAWKAAIEKENAAYDAWEKSGSDEWRAALAEQQQLFATLNSERGKLFEAAELRQFSELNGDLLAIIGDFQEQVKELIKSYYETEQRYQERIANEGGSWRRSPLCVSIDGYEWKLNPIECEKQIISALHLHFEAAKDNAAITESFKAYIAEALKSSPLVAAEGQGEPFGAIHSKGPYRTRAKAHSAANTIEKKMPQTLAQPTRPGYQYATSLYENGNAYMQKLDHTDGLKFRNGNIFFEGEGCIRIIGEAELQNMKTKEGIEKIDLPFLRICYSIILDKYQETGYKEMMPIISLYVPDFAEYLGLQRNLPQKDIAGIIDRIQNFHTIVGIINETRNGKPRQSIYPVLNFEGYNEKHNVLSFSSPYMAYVIRTLFDLSIRRDAKGIPKLKANGEPMRNPSHSFLVKSEIAKERNKAAVENVFIIVTLIEQAGDNIPNIKASTIVERNPQLKQRLNESTNPVQLLQRTFQRTWELLRDETLLLDAYIDIQLPDPKNPANIPTPKNLDKVVFTFPHKGKRGKKQPN